ncbi:MAG TPA: MaoC family dehydratase [Planctomycetota bacterium]|nr:MaoC family dehydratase [Planctomycetota bacterium]
MAQRGKYFEELATGDTAAFAKTITDADILLFTAVSGDTNPVHLDASYAATTPFEGRIAHGLLSASLISAVLGTQLPGPGTIYLSQSVKFLAPVRPGDTVEARATVTALDPAKKRATLSTTCKVGEKVVIDGEAVVKVPGRPAQ